MPSLTFVLPHWLYWAGLILFPLAAMYIVRNLKPKHGEGAVNLLTAYLFLVTAGFAGMHRFYLKNSLGLVYIPIFLVILVGNFQVREARELISDARNKLTMAIVDVESAQQDIRNNAAGAQEKLKKAQDTAATAKVRRLAADDTFSNWNLVSGSMAGLIGALLLLDALLIPGMVRRRRETEANEPRKEEGVQMEAQLSGTHEDPAVVVHTRISDVIDRISGFTGEFVCYWSLIAVFVYYYEVIARYVFNSPTNWAHEGMFLMFGMQYLISGAMTLREDSHVRVDVIYVMFPDRWKAVTDIVTSLFFFLFCGALLWSGWIFASNSIAVWEVSFTEWAIQYWPVKITIGLGALLLILQGLAKLLKDIVYLVNLETS